MATTQLGLTNLLDSATVLNDGGGGAPVSDELAPYVLDNVLVPDRYTLWRTADVPAAPVYADFDLGSDKTVSAAAILGFRSHRPANGLALTNVLVYSAPSAGGYPPAGWTLRDTIAVGSGNPRDAGQEFSSVSARYWRFEFTTLGFPFSVGRIWLGAPTDLGFIHSPGGTHRPFRNRSETPLPGGAIVVNERGDPGAIWQLPWNVINSTLRDTLLTLHAQQTGILLIDADGDFYEVIVREGAVGVSRRSDVTFDVAFELMRLP